MIGPKVQKPEGKRPSGRHRHRWEDNIVMVHKEIRWEGVMWLHLHHNRDQWQAVQHSNELLGSIKAG
jgi:hypothetical protein